MPNKRARHSRSAAQRRTMQMVVNNPEKAKRLGFKIPKSVARKFLREDKKAGITSEALPERVRKPEPEAKKAKKVVHVRTASIDLSDAQKVALWANSLIQTNALLTDYATWMRLPIRSSARLVLIKPNHSSLMQLSHGHLTEQDTGAGLTREGVLDVVRASKMSKLTIFGTADLHRWWGSLPDDRSVASPDDPTSNEAYTDIFTMRDNAGIEDWLSSRRKPAVAAAPVSGPMPVQIMQGDQLIDITYDPGTRTALPLLKEDA